MEGLAVIDFWRGKRVLLTGHTGFKGAWIGLWLHRLGATVYGLALEPHTSPALFDQISLEQRVDHFLGDIRAGEVVRDRVSATRPEIIIHLAAQPLVRHSYSDPLGTWDTNVMGTLHVLEAARGLDHTCSVVVVTTDKVYESRDQNFGYRETDRLGGRDPYSSSKAAVEIAVSSWRSSFFSGDSPVRLATARAGNVIGGGDWAEDRLVPDLVRALDRGESLEVRNPGSIRPWQHVLEPLSGYLLLAQRLYESDDPSLQESFNFGPGGDGWRTVADLVQEAWIHWPGTWKDSAEDSPPHEATTLKLNIDKARSSLGWKPRWNFSEGIRQTMTWYRRAHEGEDALRLCLEQFEEFLPANCPGSS